MVNYNVYRLNKKALIIFDGNCGICNKLKNYFSKLDKNKKLKFVAYQDNKVKKYINISEELTSLSMYTITSDNEIFKGIQAILVSLLYLNNNLNIIAKILLKSKLYLLLEPYYFFIARFRGKISSVLGYDHCIAD
ncbi:MAG: hypothetical protein HeimC3_26580 [Candidatus Heimdallarchaeota archaeon LC_3]|nr:MAG: hypothetical protein HeimC3_26580 [Candidatus Heimdallarchaeota archaeon LC_3]